MSPHTSSLASKSGLEIEMLMSDPLWSQEPSSLRLHTMSAFLEGRAWLPVSSPGSASTGIPHHHLQNSLNRDLEW